MNIALLGYGKEGQATEKYFRRRDPAATFAIFENETPAELAARDYSAFDYIFRSPSIPPFAPKSSSESSSESSSAPESPTGPESSSAPKTLTSITKYFFDHCPCPIIGVTATKGKGTTCSFIKSLLDAENYDAYLVGNIGAPALDALDDLTPSSVVVYEMSSFQLWDLEKSPHVAVIGQLEPDHLNVHKDYADYLAAKSHITAFQSPRDFLVYYSKNPDTLKLAETSKATKIPYPASIISKISDFVKLPGLHNLENAAAAVSAVAAFKGLSPEEYLSADLDAVKRGLENFRGLPHRLEFVRELGGVKYYDDNFATNASSTKVAVDAFPDRNLVIIVGGRDKTGYADLPEICEILQAPQIKRIVLLGESGRALAEKYEDSRFELVGSLEEAVLAAKKAASPGDVVLMSPAAASFDMFENVYDRGNQYKLLIANL